eukprot:187855_1
MGNEYGMMGGGWDDDGRLDRSNWKSVSDAAYRRLNDAKTHFIEFVKQYSFDNILEEHYQFTKKHAVKLHLVGKLRPKFNQYVIGFGANAKWVKLSETEKQNNSKYKNRKSAVYFCNLTIDQTVKQKLMEQEPDAYESATSRPVIHVEASAEYQSDPCRKYIQKRKQNNKATTDVPLNNEKKRKFEILDLTQYDTSQSVTNNESITKKRKLNEDSNTETVSNIDFKGVPLKFRNYKWLYCGSDQLTDDGRKKIINFLSGCYKREDVEKEDVLLKRVEMMDGNQKIVKDTVFRMCFKIKKWKKICIKRKVNVKK